MTLDIPWVTAPRSLRITMPIPYVKKCQNSYLGLASSQPDRFVNVNSRQGSWENKELEKCICQTQLPQRLCSICLGWLSRKRVGKEFKSEQETFQCCCCFFCFSKPEVCSKGQWELKELQQLQASSYPQFSWRSRFLKFTELGRFRILRFFEDLYF